MAASNARGDDSAAPHRTPDERHVNGAQPTSRPVAPVGDVVTDVKVDFAVEIDDQREHSLRPSMAIIDGSREEPAVLHPSKPWQLEENWVKPRHRVPGKAALNPLPRGEAPPR